MAKTKTKMTPRIIILVSKTQKDAVRAKAKASKMKVSAFVKDILIEKNIISREEVKPPKEKK